MDRELPVGVYEIKGRVGYRSSIWDKNRVVKQVGFFSSKEEAEYKRNIALNGHHWTFEAAIDGTTELDPKKYWGFTYLITNKASGRMYIGKKQYRLWAGPPGGYKCTDPMNVDWFDESLWAENNWQFYTGSQQDLNNEMFNPWDWKFQVLTQDADKLSNHLSETMIMIERDVLEAVDDSGEYLYYNKNIAGLEFRAPFRKKDMVHKWDATLDEVKRYYNRPVLCKRCLSVLIFPGNGGCTACSK